MRRVFTMRATPDVLQSLAARIREIEASGGTLGRTGFAAPLPLFDVLLKPAVLGAGSLVELLGETDGAGAWTLALVLARHASAERRTPVLLDGRRSFPRKSCAGCASRSCVGGAVRKGNRSWWRSTMKRVMCVYLPGWPLQRLGHEEPALRQRSVVVVDAHAARGPRVVLASRLALRSGVRPGMPLAEAQALVPRLAVHEHDAEADPRGLLQLAKA